MKPESRQTASCTAFQDALQRFLDGDGRAFNAECEAHRIECPTCQSFYVAAHRLERGLRLEPWPAAPTGFADRVLSAVLSDNIRPRSRRPTQRGLELLAIAASIALFVALGAHFTRNSSLKHPAQAPPELAKLPDPNEGALDRSFAEVSSAVASLTRRTASQTIEPARNLITTAAEAQPLRVDPMAGAVEPAHQSLATFRQGAALSFEPVAISARRAVTLFMRDLPLDNDRKRDF